MIQSDAQVVYDWLDSWADGNLMELATSIANGPVSHADQMVREWPRGSIELPELKPGHLRPFVQSRAKSSEFEASLRVLLFADEVALSGSYLCPFPSEYWVQALNDMPKIARAEKLRNRLVLPSLIRRAAIVRPLVESGALLFYEPIELTQGELFADLPAYVHLRLIQIAGEYFPEERLELEDGTPVLQSASAYVAATGASLSAIVQRRATPLALTVEDERVLSAIFSDLAHDARWMDGSKLANLLVPDFVGDPTALVSLRQSSDSLGEFRQALGAALRSITTLPDSESASRAAGELVHDAVSQQLERVRRDASRSSIGGVVRNAARRMTFTGIGAVAGGAALAGMGLPLAGALAGASTSAALNVAESVRESAKARSVKRESTKIWNVVTSFVPAAAEVDRSPRMRG